ncbi:MAG: hypothetical protein IT438_15385 [Phycisphaerales bacterium]|nr:hypothetical protein [Phycisphaerales bacterium]
MPIEQEATSTDSAASANPDLTRALASLASKFPADQALGLRLLAVARAAAAMHMADGFRRTPLASTQAAGLLRETAP